MLMLYVKVSVVYLYFPSVEFYRKSKKEFAICTYFILHLQANFPSLEKRKFSLKVHAEKSGGIFEIFHLEFFRYFSLCQTCTRRNSVLDIECFINFTIKLIPNHSNSSIPLFEYLSNPRFLFTTTNGRGLTQSLHQLKISYFLLLVLL